MAIVHKDPRMSVEVAEGFGTVVVRATRNGAAIFIHRDPKTGGLLVATSGKMSLGLHHGSPAIQVTKK